MKYMVVPKHTLQYVIDNCEVNRGFAVVGFLGVFWVFLLGFFFFPTTPLG